MQTGQKFEKLKEILQGYRSCLVAYSGGVDSVFLARVASDLLGAKALAVIADSPSLPREELREAVDLGSRFRFPVEVIRTKEFENPEYLSNPANRCYFCKHELFSELIPLAKSRGFDVIAYGENASDAADFRPGAQAAAEFSIRAPLKEAGLSKSEIRELSRQMGLPTADKPQMACLSSRIPHGEPVTPEKLSRIEASEKLLRDLGFFDVRVRFHELKGGSLARIELGPSEIEKFFSGGFQSRVSEALRGLGFSHVTMDLAGYHRRTDLSIQGKGITQRNY